MKSTDKIFDGLLVLQCQSGNKKALSLLVKRHHQRLCAHSYRYTKDAEAAKDVVQESWSTIIKKLGSLKNPNSFGSWAMRIVTRKSLDFLNQYRQNRERLKSFQHSSAITEELEEREKTIKRLQEAMRSLPKDQQIVLGLFYRENYSLKEISNILEISTGTVKSRLYHAREKLKSILNTKS